MARPILVDTDILIDYLRGNKTAAAFIEDNFDRVVLSVISVAELYAGVRDSVEQAELDDLVSFFPILSVSGEIARAGGLLKRSYGKSHGVELADAILAATAQCADASLCTLNVKHYPMLKGLKPPYTK